PSLALVPLDDVSARHQHPALGAVAAQHLAALALVAAGQHDHLVALLQLELLGHHSTSGASEMIFIWFFALSSRVTGPKMRVPIGSFCGVTSTAAFVSKRISEPSGRRTPC